MRRSLILAICVLFCGAVAAQATTVDVTFTGLTYAGVTYPAKTYVNAVEYVRTDVGAYDEIDFYLNNNSMSAGGGVWGTPGTPTGDLGLVVLEGFWTATGGGFRGQTGTKTWYKYLDNTYQDGSLPNSYVNLPYNGSAEWTNTVVTTGSGRAMYSSVHGGWFTSDAPIVSGGRALSTDVDPVNGLNTLIARMYVDHGAGVTFVSTTGSLNDPNGVNYAGGISFNNSTFAAGTFTVPPVPEPSTLLLVASGLVGLLCYAWRKRRS